MSQLNISDSDPIQSSEHVWISQIDADGLVIQEDDLNSSVILTAQEIAPLISSLHVALLRIEAMRLECGLESVLDPAHKIIFDAREFMRFMRTHEPALYPVGTQRQPMTIHNKIQWIRALHQVANPPMDLGECKSFVEIHWDELTTP